MEEVPGGRRGALAQNDLFQIVEDLLPVLVKRTAVGHDHVQLPGVDDEIPENPKPLPHESLFAPFLAGERRILLHLRPETESLEDIRHQGRPGYPPGVIRGAALDSCLTTF